MSSSATFDQSYYLTNNADVVVAISQGHFANALDHYNRFGGKELRQPNATFNPQYYAVNNADVLNAVSNGTFASVFAHYQEFGESENRAPNTNLASFDATSYLAANADVAAAVTAGTFSSALDHFITFGQNEGRSGSGVTEASNPGSTFTGTSGSDAVTGTAQSDTFNHTLVNEGGVANVLTMNTLDSLDGGAGTDTLNAVINTNVTPNSLANIENIVLTAVADATAGTDSTADTFGTANAGALVNLTLQSTADDDGVAVTGVQNALTSGLSVKNSAVNVTVTSVNTALAGSSDALTINIENVTAGTLQVDPTTGTNGYETISFVSGGTNANTLAAFSDGTSTSGTTMNFSGDQNLTITGAIEAQYTTLNASEMTGALNLTLTNAAIHNVTGGSGNDVFDLSGGFVDGSTAASRDTVNGGDGTDVLRLSSAEVQAVTSAAQFNTVTNIETVRMDTVAAGALDLANLTGVTTIEFDGGIGALTHTVASGQEMQYDLADAGNDAQTFVIEGTATDDVMNIDINGVDIGAGTQTYTGIETVNIATSGTSLIDGAHVMTATAATQAMTISGTGTLTLGNITADTITSTMTSGTLNLGVMQQATAITGGAEAMTVTGSTVADIIIGGAGADTITNTVSGAAATAGDIITGGAGNDVISLVGDQATGAVSTILGQASFITDFTVGTATTNTDVIGLSITEGNYTNASNLNEAQTAQALGAITIQTVAASAGADALTAGIDLIKLTTAVTTAGTLQAAFNTAIGTSTVTGLTASADTFFTMYDLTNSRAIIGVVDATAGTNTVVQTGDTVSLVGSIAMDTGEYANLDGDNFFTF